MRKIINAAEDFVDEVLDALLRAHPDHLALAPGSPRAVIAARPTRPGRVAIATGGGSGHLPLFLGFIGEGLLDGAAVGNVFSSPSADDMLAVTRAINGGAGVLYLYGNYGGDVFNFDTAAEQAGREGIPVLTVLGTDDIVSAPSSAAETRRGVAGLALAAKTAGAAARRGLPLEAVAAIAHRTVDHTRTMGVGLSPTILPEAGAPTFTLDDGEMEVGVGIHGEPGAYRGPIESADDIADRFVDTLLTEVTGDRVAILVNGLGATPLEELYLLYRRVAIRLEERGITIAQRYIGEYATSLEMAGASVSLCALDAELESLLDDPVDAALFTPWAPAPRTVAPPRTAPPATALPTASVTVSAASAAVGADSADGVAGSRLAAVIAATMPRWAAAADELRELDSALGDGDLGITVARGATAVAEAIGALPSEASASDVLEAAAREFGTANPSTFAALASLGATAAAGHLRDAPQDWAGAAQACFDAIARRGGAQRGDKTVLDPLGAVIDVLHQNPRAGLADLAAIAESETLARSSDRSHRGRAAWTGERSAGQLDPGSVALVRLLEALRDVAATRSGEPEVG